jgi:hypothetical protein
MGHATYKSFTSPDKNAHFHGRFGTCFDEIIEEELNCFVPKHKSYLKQKDINSRKKKAPKIVTK